jgi:hypothetical protein
MNDLHAWLSQQHHGLRTFGTFQQKLATLSGDEPGAAGLVPVAELFSRRLHRSF